MSKIFATILATFAVVLSVCIVMPAVSQAVELLDPVCTTADSPSPICEDAEVPTEPGNNPIWGPDGVIKKGIEIISVITGIAAVFMFMIGGFKYIMAGGDSSELAKAKRTVIFAVVGMLLALFAQAIIVFVINEL